MTDSWNFSGDSATLGHAGATVTLVEGSAFCISERSGDVLPHLAQGLFFGDTRIVSRLEVRVDRAPPEPLEATALDPFSAVFVSRARPQGGRADSTLMVLRRRYVGRGMREDVTVRNFGEEATYCALELTVEADFADLFAVKEGRAGSDGEHTVESAPGRIVLRHRRGAVRRGLRVDLGAEAVVHGTVATFQVVVPARGEWSTCVQLTPIVEDDEVAPTYACGEPVERASAAERMAEWRRNVPLVETDHEPLASLVARGAEDLGALRIFDPDYPDQAVVAAGAPWFMTLFGRDSLLTAWMALLVDPGLAKGVLQTLARFQGEKEDPRFEEEPGRILHEVRFGSASSLSLGGGSIYYGTADATPLFVMLLGELRRWGLEPEAVDELLPAADRALSWVEHYGDRDGDGYVEYRRATDKGLQNQGWKDSHDGVRFADGRIARAPIALCEVQGYVYAAYLARMYFAKEAGDVATEERYRDKARTLKEAFNRDFWLPERGWLAMGLDADKRPIDALTSNMGHCLWTGILDPDKARAVARHLVTPEMFSGWGVRTLATSMQGYNPISYHCGSVWPHDNAIVAAGLMRYGFVEEAQRVILALVDAGASQGGRLPELFAGLERAEFPFPVDYPSSCSPQAWAAGSPLLFLRTLLRFDPWVPHGRLWLDPVLPPSIERLRVGHVPLAGARVTVEVDRSGVSVEGLPPGVELVSKARHPLTAA